MTTRIELDHCVIHVSEWERSNRFYADVLGAELIDRGNGVRQWTRIRSPGSPWLPGTAICASAGPG